MSAVAVRTEPMAEAADRVELLRDHHGVYGITLSQASGSRQPSSQLSGSSTSSGRIGSL
jgi:hypothetical protein